MRAVFTEEIVKNGQFVVSGDRAHHLINVIRVKGNERILLLDGKGSEALAEVVDIQKKTLTLSVLNYSFHTQTSEIDLAVAITKKDALEEILKLAVELKIRNIHLLKTKFSQPFQLKEERISALFESAIIQSNNHYIPSLHREKDILSFKENITDYKRVFFFTLGERKEIPERLGQGPFLICIGPEAGFDASELEAFKAFDHCHFLSLETAILRAPTAVATATGFVLGRK